MLSLQQERDMSKDYRERKYSNNKRYEKAEKAIDGDEDDLLLCLLTTDNKKQDVKRYFLVCRIF